MSCARETCSSIDTNWDELTAGRINLLYLSGLSRWFISFSSASAAVLPVRHQIWGYRRDTMGQAVGITEFLCIRSFSWNNEGFWFSEDWNSACTNILLKWAVCHRAQIKAGKSGHCGFLSPVSGKAQIDKYFWEFICQVEANPCSYQQRKNVSKIPVKGVWVWLLSSLS